MCLFSPVPLSPAPPADDVSEDNAELRRNLPPSPEGRHLFRARPQSCTVNFQSAARVLLRQSHPESRAGNKPSQNLNSHNHGEGPLKLATIAFIFKNLLKHYAKTRLA